MIKQCQQVCSNPCNKQFQTAVAIDTARTGPIHKTVPEFKAVNNNKSITEFVLFSAAHDHVLSHTDDTFIADEFGWKHDTFSSRDYNIQERRRKSWYY